MAEASATLRRQMASKLGGLGRPQTRLALGVGVIVMLVGCAFFLPLPFAPNATDVRAIAQPPGPQHLFGTDLIGRDVFSRVVASGKRDIPLSIAGMLVSLAVGVPLGLLASGKTKWGERLMRMLDGFESLPLLILSIATVTLAGNRVENVAAAIAIVNAPRFMRLVRSQALVLRESRFIEAAIAIGCSPLQLMFRHLLPNVMGVVLVQSSLAAASGILIIASLNFLGIGLTPPDPTWGSMIRDGAHNIAQGQWWMAIWPSVAVLITVVGLNQIADSLDEVTEEATR